MPSIPTQKKAKSFSDSSVNSLAFKYVYNTRRWKKLRLFYLQKHSLCEKCKEKGKLKLAVDVHHLHSINTGRNKAEMQRLGYDYNNLCAVCSDCHNNLHHGFNDFTFDL